MRRLTLALVPLALAACDHEPAGLVMEEPRVSMDVITAQPQPLPAPPVAVVINSSPGQQVDPHVDGGIASYTDFAAGAQIRYYDFATGVDLAIPTSDRDQLSDVSAGRIVFTRILTDGNESVMLFDATTGGAPVEVNPVSPPLRSAVAIGGTTIAYVDHALVSTWEGEIVVWDLVNSVATRITDDGNIDQAPAVSADGSVIVWERCPATSLSNCDVAMAVRTGSAWTVSDVAGTPAPEGFPDVDDGNVTWTAWSPGTGWDIYWRAVAGGAVQQLALAGDQVHGAISGDLITFEGISGGATDVFAYHMVDGVLYQITNTPGVQESLNDVTVLLGGSPSLHTVRVVWQANDGADGLNDIHGATFTLPHDDVAAQIAGLVSLVESFNLHQGIENSLDAKLDAAESALAAAQGGNITTACNLMDAFLNEVMAQSGKKISVYQADQLIQAANNIKASLGCP